MTVTLDPSIAPKLDPRTEVGVNILKLPPRAELAASLGCGPSDAAVLTLAAKIAGPGKKSDIVVFDHQPWHRVNGQLLPHPEAHTVDGETILQISFKRKERPVWWSAERFTILDIQPSAHHGTPAAGVPESERHDILAAVASLPREVSVLLIEHDMDLVFSFAERITVLVNGALFTEGTVEEIANDPKVRAVYLGEGESGGGSEG